MKNVNTVQNIQRYLPVCALPQDLSPVLAALCEAFSFLTQVSNVTKETKMPACIVYCRPRITSCDVAHALQTAGCLIRAQRTYSAAAPITNVAVHIVVEKVHVEALHFTQISVFRHG